MASVRSNSNGNCLIELGRNNKKVRVITRLETVYDVREMRLVEKELVGKGVDKVEVLTHFDKEFTPVIDSDGVQYDVKKCALKYLGNKFTPCTDRARRELMILVLNSELNLVAKFASDQMPTALETGPEGGHAIMNPEEIANGFEVEDIATIYKNVGGYEPEKTKEKLEKNSSYLMRLSVAKQIYSLSKNLNLNPLPAKKSPSSPKSEKVQKPIQEKHPVTTAIINALKIGGTKEVIVSHCEKALEANIKINTNHIKQHFSVVCPILILAGSIEEVSGSYKWL